MSFDPFRADAIRFNDGRHLIQRMMPDLLRPIAAVISHYRARLALSKVEHTGSARPCILTVGESCVQPLANDEAKFCSHIIGQKCIWI
jgi:hypothetical protein